MNSLPGFLSILAFVSCCLQYNTCFSQKTTIKQGVLKSRIFVYKDPTSPINLLEDQPTNLLEQPALLKTGDIYFYGDYCIELVLAKKQSSIGDIGVSLRFDTTYWFIDNKKARCFQFSSLTDTATIIQQCSLKEKPFGLGSNSIKNNTALIWQSETILPDTIITGQRYVRAMISATTKSGNTLLTKYYFDPSRKYIPDFYAKQDIETGQDIGFLRLIESESYREGNLLGKMGVILDIEVIPLNQKWYSIFRTWIKKAGT